MYLLKIRSHFSLTTYLIFKNTNYMVGLELGTGYIIHELKSWPAVLTGLTA